MSGLVLSRNIGEGVYILRAGQTPVYVSVAEIQGGTVRLRFEGSQDNLVMRDDIVAKVLPGTDLAQLIEIPVSQELIDRFRKHKQ